MTNDDRIDSLEQRVHILSLTTQGDNSHQLSAIESKLATVSKTLAEVKNSIPQSGPSLATIKDLIEKTVAKRIAQFQQMILPAIGTNIGEQVKLVKNDIESRVGAIQSSAAMARAATRSAIEASVTRLEHAALTIGVSTATQNCDRMVDLVFKTLDVQMGRIHQSDPRAIDLEAYGGNILFNAQRALQKQNDKLNHLGKEIGLLLDVCCFLKGEGALPSNVDDGVKSAAIVLKTATASGFPGRQTAEKVEEIAIGQLSQLREYQDHLTARRVSALDVAGANGLANAFKRLAKESTEPAPRALLTRKATEHTARAESLKATHRATFPRSTR